MTKGVSSLGGCVGSFGVELGSTGAGVGSLLTGVVSLEIGLLNGEGTDSLGFPNPANGVLAPPPNGVLAPPPNGVLEPPPNRDPSAGLKRPPKGAPVAVVEEEGSTAPKGLTGVDWIKDAELGLKIPELN